MKYLVNKNVDLHIQRGAHLTVEMIEAAVERTHVIIDKINGYEIDISEILGMRNLSAFVGELFAASLAFNSEDLLKKNPHQDGYPDLLLMDKAGLREWRRLDGRWRDKGPFSPFATGGVEVKATCGNVPTDEVCRKLKFPGKPNIGDQRIQLLNGYDWKAHHQETNYLLGLVWDFLERMPRITGVFYCNSLDVLSGKENRHWSPIIQPKSGGGRTTSVSIMTRDGVRHMYSSWVLVYDDKEYKSFFDKHNKGSLFSGRLKVKLPPY